MDSNFRNKPPIPSDSSKEAPKSRRICAWCKKDMGPSATERDSHGICESCAAEQLKKIEDPQP